MERDTLKEKIKYYTELLKIFWAIEVVLIGGLSTLFINLHNPFKISLFVLGLFLLGLGIALYFETRKTLHLDEK